jgi:hypothetical protein
MYDYLLSMYAFVNDCTEGRIRNGRVTYYLHWTFGDDGIGRSAGFELHDTIPPENISGDDLTAFAACVQRFISSHDVPQYGPETWAETASFPLETMPLVTFAKEHAESN